MPILPLLSFFIQPWWLEVEGRVGALPSVESWLGWIESHLGCLCNIKPISQLHSITSIRPPPTH